MPFGKRLDALAFVIVFAFLLGLLWIRPDMPIRPDIRDLVEYKRFYDGEQPDMFGWGSLLYVLAARISQVCGLTAHQFMFALSAVVLTIKAYVAVRLASLAGTRLVGFAFLAMPAFFLVDFFELRNAASQAFLLMALLYAIERSWIKSCISSMFAVGFHFSALPFVPLIYFPFAGLALLVCVVLVLAIGPALDFDYLLVRLRGHPGAGALGNKGAVLKVLGQSVGGYLVPMAAFIYAFRRKAVCEYASAMSVVAGSLVFFVGLWLIPSVPDALYHRLHRVGWFGVTFLLLLISRRPALCWLVSAPITVTMFVYYAYLNLDFAGILR